MLTLAAVIALAFVVLLLAEFVRLKFNVSNEDSRKTYHIVHALVIGIAPFLVDYKVIIILELLLGLNMVVVKKYNLFGWLYQVGRVSWGEYFGIAGVILIALLNPNPWIFLAAMLHLGFADALAALIGKRYGSHNQFKVFGQTKSLQGAAAFYLTSLAIVTLAIVTQHLGISGVWLVVLVPPIMTLAETASPFGSDNFIIPVLTVLMLNGLRLVS